MALHLLNPRTSHSSGLNTILSTTTEIQDSKKSVVKHKRSNIISSLRLFGIKFHMLEQNLAEKV